MALFHVENLTYHYPDEERAALAGTNLDIRDGEFLFLTGPSGCGKSTLLRALAGLLPDYYGGLYGGVIRYRGQKLQSMDRRQLAREIGIIFQNPEQQSVMTRVEQEIAFGLENLGVPKEEMHRRVSEVLALFGLSSKSREAIFNLSGGQKQKVVLAAIMAMHPRVLLLDEPTSQLDPVAAQEFLNFVQRLNQEWGVTVVLVEQRVDRCFHLADRVILMDGGKVRSQGEPRDLVVREGQRYPFFIPPVSRVFLGRDIPAIPLTIKEGRRALEKVAVQLPSTWGGTPGSPPDGGGEEAVLEARNLEFAYPSAPPCLKKVSLSLPPGSITAVLGENGAGKSTLLKNINGLLTPGRGSILLEGRDITGTRVEERSAHIGYMSQNPEDYLFNERVADEVAYGLKLPGKERDRRVDQVLEFLDIRHTKEKNPRDLSGGEKQRVALAVVLAPDPRVLLLDEPTRGMDASLKHRLRLLLEALKDAGKAVMVVTHDVEFAAEAACRVLIMADGKVVARGGKREILSSSLYYSPQVSRMFRDLSPGVMTVEEGRNLLRFLDESGREGVG